MTNTTKAPFGKDVMPHNTEAGFSQLHNKAANFTVLQNNGNTDTKRVQKAIQSDATPAKSGGDINSFFGGK